MRTCVIAFGILMSLAAAPALPAGQEGGGAFSKPAPKAKAKPKTRKKPTAKPGINMSGAYSSSGWGTVRLRRTGGSSYSGTYTTTYRAKTGSVRITFRGRRGSGSWGEGSVSGGWILSAVISPDGRTISGRYNRTRHFSGSTHGAASFTWRKR